MRYVLGSRAGIGGVLGSGRGGAAAAWYLAGGVSAANCVAAYAPKGAASLAASYTNLANPGTYDCTVGVAPTWAAATGWTFAASAYLTTGITPASDVSWTVLCRFSNLTNDGAVFGSVGPGTFYLRPNMGGNSRYAYRESTYYDIAPTKTSGVQGWAGNTRYRDGTADGATVGSINGALPTIFIGARNNAGNAISQLSGKIQAFAIYNVTLDAATVAAISAAMAAL